MTRVMVPKSKDLAVFVGFILLVFVPTTFAMIDYCRNNTFDQPTNSEKLHFSKENSDEEFGIYDKFKCLHCCSHGYRSIEWYKDGHPYPWPTDVSTLIIYSESGNQTIYSQKLTSADSGEYWCVVKNETYFLRHEVHLTVSGPSISMEWPKVTYKPRDQRSNVGDSVRFYCEAFVGTIDLPDFQSEINWIKGDGSPQTFANGMRIIQEKIFREEKRVIGAYLNFVSVEGEDFGRYICRVKNFGDQVLELSAWLSEKTDNETTTEIPICSSGKVPVVTREFYVIVLFLVMTMVTTTMTFLHFGPYFLSMKNRIFRSSVSKDDAKLDLLIVYHENDAGDGLSNLLKARYRYSYCLYPVTDKSQIGGEKLKAKATAFRGLLVLMTPELVGGFWSCGTVYRAIHSLLKIHFTVICYFVKGLPPVDETDRNLMLKALNKVHYVEGTGGKNTKFWNSLRLKLQEEKSGDESSGTGKQNLIPV